MNEVRYCLVKGCVHPVGPDSKYCSCNDKCHNSLPNISMKAEPKEEEDIFSYSSPLSALRPTFAQSKAKRTEKQGRIEGPIKRTTKRSNNEELGSMICSMSGCSRPKVGMGKGFCSVHYVSASLKEALNVEDHPLGKLQKAKIPLNEIGNRKNDKPNKNKLEPLKYKLESMQHQVPLHVEYMQNPFSRHKVVRLHTSRPSSANNKNNGIAKLSDVLSATATNTHAIEEKKALETLEDSITNNTESKEEAEQKQLEKNLKEELGKETYTSIMRLSPVKKSNAVDRQRHRRVMLVQQLKEKEKRLAALMSTHQNSFELLGGFLKSRPTKSRLQQNNILKTSTEKGKKQIGGTLEMFFQEKRPSKQNLENRNIIRQQQIELKNRADGFSRMYLRRQGATELYRRNILLDSKRNQELKDTMDTSKKNLKKRLLNRPKRDSIIIKNIVAERAGKVENVSSGLSKLLEKRPEANYLTNHNILKDKERTDAEETENKNASNHLSNVLTNRISIDQMVQKGVLYSAPGTVAPQIEQKKRNFEFNFRRDSLFSLLSNRVAPDELLDMTNRLELERIAEEDDEEFDEDELQKQMDASDRRRRRQSFFDGVGVNELGVNDTDQTNRRKSIIEAVGRKRTSISELVRIDHVVAAHKRHIESDKGTEGGVYVWGNGSKELGLGDIKLVITPQLLQTIQKEVITMIACGKGHTLALTRLGSAYSWGANQWGQLGLGDTQNRTQPFCMKFRASPLYEQELVSVSASEKTSAVINSKGNVYIWGYAKDGSLGCGTVKRDIEPLPIIIDYFNNKNIKQIALGPRHSCGLTDEGVLYSWGVGSSGALGHDEKKNYNRPKVLDRFNEFFEYVDCGTDYTAAIGFDGSVYTWGKNDFGQLGKSSTSPNHIPTPVMSLWRKHIVKISCGRHHTVALSHDGSVYSTYVSTNSKESSFHRLMPTRILCDCVANWDDVVSGISVDGRLVTWDAKSGEFLNDNYIIQGKTLSHISAGEKFTVCIGTWHVFADDPYQDLKNCHKPLIQQKDQAQQRRSMTRRKLKKRTVMPMPIPEVMNEKEEVKDNDESTKITQE